MGIDFAFSGQGRRAFYVGFSQHRFGCRDAGCPSDAKYVATGFNAGFRFDLLTRGEVIPWIRVGAVTTRLETDPFPGYDGGVSDLGIGGEVGLGLFVGMWNPVALNPGIRLSAVNTELPGGSLLRMRYLVADLSIALSF